MCVCGFGFVDMSCAGVWCLLASRWACCALTCLLSVSFDLSVCDGLYSFLILCVVAWVECGYVVRAAFALFGSEYSVCLSCLSCVC